MKDFNVKYKNFITSKKHHAFRTSEMPDPSLFTSGPHDLRITNRFKALLEIQNPVFIENELFIPTRTDTCRPEIITKNDPEYSDPPPRHELGWISNLAPNYEYVIKNGLLHVKNEINKALEATTDTDKIRYASCLSETVDAILAFTEKYRLQAIKNGKTDIAETLQRVPAYGAKSYRQALQSFRILHFCLWLEGNYHVTVGRFDQYMLPYLQNDLQNGVLTYDQALDMTENFFITFNKDSDLYVGMQMGDNGQSMMLGGRDAQGNDEYNLLSEMCIKASKEVMLIDPKINLRVDKNTPAQRFVFGSELTATGMGFPQYSNDDAVIPGLIALGYDEKDAVNYSVAACWEFIIPGLGMEIPNIDYLSFPDCVNTAIKRDLEKCKNMDEFLSCVTDEIKTRCARFEEKHKGIVFHPAPLMSIMMDGCVEKLTDISKGNKYNNYGIHGVGVASGADAIAAVEQLVFKENFPVAKLIDALETNYAEYRTLRNKILTQLPHMGNNDDRADKYAILLLECFANALKPLRNERNGIYRAGTGTAMYYASERSIGATADGRTESDFLPANYSPSLGVKLAGPLSIIQSFTKPDMKKFINGGPLTLELASNAVQDREGIEKTAFTVKKFIELGGHQIQLNVVNKDMLTDAQAHPEKYKNLVVRVWGWSGYFTELDKVYQDQILSRTEHSF